MKKLLGWVAVIVGAVGFVAFDFWLIRLIVRGGNSAPEPPDMAALEVDVGDTATDPEFRDLPVVRPKWLDLPPINLVKLSNGTLTVQVTRPDDPGAYHDSRFDWSGMIARVDYNGHIFFNGPKAQLDDKTNYPVFGTAEEFGMNAPLGFSQAKVGETFVKIGVGELVRPASPPWYWWGIPYTVAKPGTWTVRQGESWIEYEQQLNGPRGIGYRYTKRIALEASSPVIRISRKLANTGWSSFTTSHYCHNFVSIDDEDVGPPWRIEFNYPIVPHPNPKYWRTRGLIRPEGKSVYLEPWSGGAMFAILTSKPHPAEDNSFRIVNPDLGSSVSIRGDRPVTRISLYIANPTISVEPFVELTIPPGNEESWETVYTFDADPGKVTTRPAKSSRKNWRDKLMQIKK